MAVPITTSENPATMKLFPGMSINLACKFSGVPQPFLYWQRGGIVLFDGTDEVVIVTSGIHSNLTVLDSMGESGGEYGCYARNVVGLSSSTFNVECKFKKIINAIIKCDSQ